jgi:hypothetical protein
MRRDLRGADEIDEMDAFRDARAAAEQRGEEFPPVRQGRYVLREAVQVEVQGQRDTRSDALPPHSEEPSMVTKLVTKSPRTPHEIAAEVAALRAMKPYVRQHGMFGNDNHACIDAQVEVLEQRLTEDQIWDRYNRGPDGDDEDADDDQSLLDCACAARNWMVGVDSEAPSEGWKVLDNRRTT